MKTDKGLTQEQELFCLEFCKDLNASRAYASAYGNPKGAQPSSAKLLSNPIIIERVKELLTPILENKLVTVDEVIGAIKEIAFNKTELTPNRIRALELLGKYLALFTDNNRHTFVVDDETKDAVKDLKEKLG
jgi:phage terminase small subunit